MAASVKYLQFKRNTLLEELQGILKEYPDNEQIIKEIIQNAEDARASQIGIAFCSNQSPSSSLPEPYRSYLEGPGLCFYNDSKFSDEDWDGITMVRKSVKKGDPLAIGKFGLGFKSVFHITDYVCVISGESILFIDPLQENQDYRRICPFNKLTEYGEICGSRALEPLYGIFGIDKFTTQTGQYDGTFFWLPFRKMASDLSVNIYSESKVHELFRSFEEEAAVELIFLKHIEKINIFRHTPSTKMTMTMSVEIDDICVDQIRTRRQRFNEDLSLIEEQLTIGESISTLRATQMEYVMSVNVKSIDTECKIYHWLVVQYYHAGYMDSEMRYLIDNPRFIYRPHMGIAIQVNTEEKTRGGLFCFLPLPSQNTSPTGLPVHVNGFLALDSNRQHLKWSTPCQKIAKCRLEHDVIWNELMVKDVFPIVYKKFLNCLAGYCKYKKNSPDLMRTFYQSIPTEAMVTEHWKSIVPEILCHILQNELPNQMDQTWIKTTQAVFEIYPTSVHTNTRITVSNIFKICKGNVLPLPGFEDIFTALQRHYNKLISTTPSQLRKLMSKDGIYKNCNQIEKLHLLKYACADDRLDLLYGLDVIPLYNSTCSLHRRGSREDVFVCNDGEGKLLLGKSSAVVNMPESTRLRQVLNRVANTEYYQLIVMNKAQFIRCLADVMSKSFPMGNVIRFDPFCSTFNKQWLKGVWTYLETYSPKSLDDKTQGLRIVPFQPQNDAQAWLCSLKERLVLENSDISRDLREALEHLSIKFVCSGYIEHPLMFPGGHFVSSSTPDGIMLLLQRSLGYEVLQSFNSKCSNYGKLALKHYLYRVKCPIVKDVLRKLQIFEQRNHINGNSEMVSIQQCNKIFVADPAFPVKFPEPMIVPESQEDRILAHSLGGKNIDSELIVESALDIIQESYYSKEEKRKLSLYLLRNYGKFADQTRNKLTCTLSKVPFINYHVAKDFRYLRCARELYDPNDDILSQLFQGESRHLIREERAEMVLLEGLSFKKRHEIIIEDLMETARIIDIEQKTSPKKDRLKVLYSKALALMFVISTNKNLANEYKLMDAGSKFDPLYNLKCFVYDSNKPDQYPPSLPWHQGYPMFCTPKDLQSRKALNLIGTVLPVVQESFMSLCENVIPATKFVIKQLEHVITNFCHKDITMYLRLINDIYKHLNCELYLLDYQLPKRCVFVENTFTNPENIYRHRKKSDVDLRPYKYPIPHEFQQYENFLTMAGCHIDQSISVLIETLHLIEQKHELTRGGDSDSDDDLRLVCQILCKIEERFQDVELQMKEQLPIPIITKDKSRLYFSRPDDCVYCDLEWLKNTFEDDDKIKYVHPDLPASVVKVLGIQSLQKQMLSDSEDFGQSEQLMARLKSLLEEGYTDGFSVPKEIIQNADDAGASVVKFLYDERQNKDARTRLIDSGMESCQGPAFWSFNDATFSEEDFRNIKNLSGATKKHDTTKIGQFGLGFNAVYNLTDVPSFLSGNHLVYLDPHGTYLGDAIKNRENPGKKLNLKNGAMLKKLENQFKPFKNVFGCNLNSDQDHVYQGTLFRLPLRTKEQAYRSEICDIYYSPEEMKKLLRQLCDAAGNLLLFTQNVKEIYLYHIPDTETEPEKMKLVLHVKKEETYTSRFGEDLDIQQTNLQLANALMQQSCAKIQEKGTAISMIKISLKTTADAFHLCNGLDQINVQTLWRVCWALGQKEALSICRNLINEGALPVASVALPLEYNKDLGCISPKEISKVPFGFYKVSHAFCYLPLPVETPLPVHVNGSFQVSKDRQRLFVQSEDDKGDSHRVQWNKALITDALLQAYMLLLEILKDTMACTLYNCWPQCTENPWNIFESTFYRTLIEHDKRLFYRDKNWLAFSECTFLCQEIRNDKNIGDKALSFMNKFVANLVDISDTLWIAFARSNCLQNLLEQTIKFEEFYIVYFLPNLNNISATDVHDIILHAIESENENVLNKMKCYECISTVPNGTLRKPSDLVNPYGICANLFSMDAEVFPDKVFCQSKCLKTLEQLGMANDEINWNTLVNQASETNSISKKCSTCAEKRSEHVLFYMYKQKVNGNICPERTLELLSDVPFLPVLQKPDDWPFSWKGMPETKLKLCPHHESLASHGHNFGTIFEKPRQLYFKKTKYLVGCSEFVIDEKATSLYLNELKQLRVKDRDDVSVNTIGNQLLTISREWNEISDNSNLKYSQLLDICASVYESFDLKMADKHTEQYIHNNLTGKRIVLIGQQFVKPQKVIFSINHDCAPDLHGMNNNPLAKFKYFLSGIGVREQFNQSDIIEALKNKKEKFEEHCLPPDTLSLVCRIALQLEEYKDIDNNELYLPDKDGVMRHVDDLCLDDCDWIKQTYTMNILNPEIPLTVANLANIKSKRMHDIFEDSEEFGQQENLTDRIKRILDGYPEISIMKELIQNADDAGATELHFIKDFRQHGIEHVFSEEWKSLQGPALCVFNDSVFTEKDLIGIQSVGIGSKGNDATLIGQYGVGFISVYHMTDVPSFLIMDENDKTKNALCVFDPHCQYIPGANVRKPGRKFRNPEKIKEKYKDIFPAYLNDTDIWKNHSGTLFRLPLRKNETDSKISSKVFSTEQIEELLADFKDEIADCLLFLPNIRKICISHVTDDGSINQEFFAESNISGHIGKCLSDLIVRPESTVEKDSVSLLSLERSETRYKLEVSVNDKRQETWLIVNGVGFFEPPKELGTLTIAFQDKQLTLFPCGGVAFPLENDKKKNGRAYCYLPLPVETGLPVHVNGHFALDHEARRNIWWPVNDDVKKCWNKCILEGVIAPAYVSLMDFLKKELLPEREVDNALEQLSTFYSVFPDVDNFNSSIWGTLITALYRYLKVHNCRLFPVVRSTYDPKYHVSEVERNVGLNHRKCEKPSNIEWVCIGVNEISPAYFDDLCKQICDDHINNYKESQIQKYKTIPRCIELGSILKNIGLKLLHTPLWIYRNIKKVDENVQTIDPLAVIKFLKTYRESQYHDKCRINKVDVDLNSTCLKNAENVDKVIRYCSKEIEMMKENIEGTPLLVTSDNVIRLFSNRNQILVTRFSELFPNSKSEIVHKKIYCSVGGNKKETLYPECLRYLNLEKFVELLKLNDHSVFKGDTVSIPRKDSPKCSDEYISDFLGSLYGIYERCLATVLDTVEMILERERNSSESVCSTDTSAIPRSKEEATIQCTEKFLKKVYVLIGDYMVFPALQPVNGKPDLPMLFALKWTKTLVDSSIQREFFLSLRLPKADFMTHNYNMFMFFKQFVTSDKNPHDMLDCLLHHVTHIKSQGISKQICNSILNYFQEHLEDLLKSKDSSVKQKLKKLPFYSTISNSNTPNSINNNLVLVLPHTFPREGICQWERCTGITLLEENNNLEKLFEFINCTTVDICSIYCDYIFKDFQHIPDDAVVPHMEYIRDIVIPKLRYENKEKQLQYFTNVLRHLRFIPTIYHCRKSATEYFDPWIQLYREFCFPHELPPNPFSEFKWKDFMKMAGIQTSITTRALLNFARQFENESNESYPITEVIIQKSKLLVQCLLEIPNLSAEQSFLEEISEVRFLIPMEIPQEFQRLLTQHDSENKLVSFSETASKCNLELVWSTMPLLSSRLYPKLYYRDMKHTRAKLGIADTPHFSKVRKHICNLCQHIESGSGKILQTNKCLESTFCSTMLKIYEYLSCNSNQFDQDTFRNIALIYIKKHLKVVRPSRVVLDMQETDEVPPYLFKAPLYYGQYHSLFRDLGASNVLESNHYALVLLEIKNAVGDKKMAPTELSSVKKAVCNLFHLLSILHDQNSLTISELFLPDREKCLVSNRNLVFSIDSNLEKRIGQNLPLLKIFVGFQSLEISTNDQMKYMQQLPDKYLPKMLSKLVCEVVTAQSKLSEVSPSSKASRLQEFLTCSEFICGVLRLIHHNKQRNNHNFTEDELNCIQSKLRNVEVKQVEILTTSLTYKGTILENTEKNVGVFLEMEINDSGKDNNQIYFQDLYNTTITDWLSDHTTCTLLAVAINELTQEKLGDVCVYLPGMFEYCSCRGNITNKLDQLGICSFGIIPNVAEPFIPALGSEIPLTMHHLLDNSFSYFEVRELIAFEVYDPLINNPDSVEECDDPVYILAMIMERISDISTEPLDVEYLIDVGGQFPEKVKSSRIYKFNRRCEKKDESIDVVDGTPIFNWNLNAAKRYILKIVRESLSKSTSERRRIFKRLMLDYHPDKHQHRKEYFTDIFQFIQHLLQKVENGENLDNIDVCSSRMGHSTKSSSFYSRMYRRGRSYRNDDETYQNTGESFFDPFKKRGPQPGQAQRWFRQAEHDLNAARNDIHDTEAYNWVCFKCHQAVEKGLKALVYNSDSNMVEFHTHRLSQLSSSLGDRDIQGMVVDLERITGSYFRMRYPDAVSQEYSSSKLNIPSEIYHESDAKEALMCAENILTKVREKLT